MAESLIEFRADLIRDLVARGYKVTGAAVSHSGGRMKGGPRKWFARITVQIGVPLPPETTAAELKEATQRLLDKQ